MPKRKFNADALLTLEELAEYCGVSYQHMRDCFREGLLPEPRNMIRGKRKTTRRFTQREAEIIRRLFASSNPAKWRDVRRRARIRKQVQGR